jgi:predicted enzyme related to lactoylglutathione lyase
MSQARREMSRAAPEAYAVAQNLSQASAAESHLRGMLSKKRGIMHRPLRLTMLAPGAMHRSRLAGFILDCETHDLPAAADFWSQALGVAKGPPDGDKYIVLEGEAALGLHIEVQSVDHPSRVHLDIETDDVEAEAKRLEALGARRVGSVRTWIVLEAPTGQRFCVVRAKRSLEGVAGASQWP